MKTSEFIEKVEDIGFLIEDVDPHIYIYMNRGDDIIADVNKMMYCCMNTAYDGFQKLLRNEDKRKLLKIMKEYVETPLNKREEEKRFTLKHKYLMDQSYLMSESYLMDDPSIELSYLNQCRHNNSLLFLDPLEETEDYKTEFTDEDIEDLNERLGINILRDFEKIEVMENE